MSDVCVCGCFSEAAAHAVATLAEATLQGGGQIVLAETAAAVGALAGVHDATGTHSSIMLSSACKIHLKRQNLHLTMFNEIIGLSG